MASTHLKLFNMAQDLSNVSSRDLLDELRKRGILKMVKSHRDLSAKRMELVSNFSSINVKDFEKDNMARAMGADAKEAVLWKEKEDSKGWVCDGYLLVIKAQNDEHFNPL